MVTAMERTVMVLLVPMYLRRRGVKLSEDD